MILDLIKNKQKLYTHGSKLRTSLVIKQVGYAIACTV